MYHQNKGEKQNRKKQKNSNDNNTAPSTFDNSPNNNNNNSFNKNNNSSEISNPNNSTSQINSEAPPKDSDSFSNNIISDTNKNDNNIISITKKANPTTTTYTESNASITIRALYEKETTTSRSQTLPIRDKQLWTFGSTQEEKRRWLIFEDLWKRGYWLTNGSKFGGDFLVYPGNITITRQ